METKDFHAENYNTVMKKSKVDKEVERYIMFLDCKINNVKMTLLDKSI